MVRLHAAEKSKAKLQSGSKLLLLLLFAINIGECEHRLINYGSRELPWVVWLRILQLFEIIRLNLTKQPIYWDRA